MKKLLGLIIFCIPLYVLGSDDSSADSEFDENPVISEVIQNEKYEKNKLTRLFIEGSGGGIPIFSMGWSGNVGIELKKFQLYVGVGQGGATIIVSSMWGTYLSLGIRTLGQFRFQFKGRESVENWLFGIQAHYYLEQGSDETPLPVSIIIGKYWDIGEYFRIGGCGVLGGPEVLTFRALLNILIPL